MDVFSNQDPLTGTDGLSDAVLQGTPSYLWRPPEKSQNSSGDIPSFNLAVRLRHPQRSPTHHLTLSVSILQWQLLALGWWREPASRLLSEVSDARSRGRRVFGHERAEIRKFYVAYLPHLRSLSQVHRVYSDKNRTTESLDQLSYPPTCSVVLILLGCHVNDTRVYNLFPAPRFRETNFADVRRVRVKLTSDVPEEVRRDFRLAIELINPKGTRPYLEWIEEVGQYGSVETLCLLGGCEDLGGPAASVALSMIATLILSDVGIPSWLVSAPSYPCDEEPVKACRRPRKNRSSLRNIPSDIPGP